jgi:hypothetical protein
MFRFTIRELVLLTIIVALAVGWSLDHSILHQKMAGIIRLYDSAATRLNATSKRDDEAVYPVMSKSR